MAMRCFCPPDSWMPFCPTWVAKPSGSKSTKPALAACAAARTSSIVASARPKVMFSAMLAENRTCGRTGQRSRADGGAWSGRNSRTCIASRPTPACTPCFMQQVFLQQGLSHLAGTHRLLGHDADVAAQPPELQQPDVHAVQQHLPRLRVVKALHQAHLPQEESSFKQCASTLTSASCPMAFFKGPSFFWASTLQMCQCVSGAASWGQQDVEGGHTGRLTTVDLPLPEGPTSATVAPASTVSEKLLNTCGTGGACCTLQDGFTIAHSPIPIAAHTAISKKQWHSDSCLPHHGIRHASQFLSAPGPGAWGMQSRPPAARSCPPPSLAPRLQRM